MHLEENIPGHAACVFKGVCRRLKWTIVTRWGGDSAEAAAQSGDSTPRNRAGLGHLPTESVPVHHGVSGCVRVSTVGSASAMTAEKRYPRSRAQTGVLRYGPRCLRALTGANTLIPTRTASSISLL